MVAPQTSPRSTSVAELIADADDYLERAAAGAAQRDPAQALVADLAQRGLGSFRVPAAFGGPGGSIADVIGFVVALAAVDANVAQTLRPHFATVESLVHEASEQEQQRWFARVLDGELFGLAYSENGAANGAIATRIAADGVVRTVEREAHASSRSHVTTFEQLFLAAVEAGIARNVLTDAVWFVNKRSRPIKHSSASRSVDDPYIQRTTGEIASRAYAARATVLAAAATLDRALALEAGDDALTEAAVEVAQAQLVAAELALRSAELLFDVGGGSATARELNFDRHWRIARTVATHSPRDYKASVVGAYRLSGTEPPTGGPF